ncbi:EF-hand domain [Macleaya cordata]|uniref:EF-hand domain n=1 Tax=Macleaya cordata TaxID=56857 RepID=A0A200Q0D9_MACCD|nr:EF-hand domain [Macleaya cordata]
MAEIGNPLSVSILNFITSSFFRSFIDVLIEFQKFYYSILWCNHTKIDEIRDDDQSCSNKSLKKFCMSCDKNEGLLMEEDIDVVLEKLGMSSTNNYNSEEEYDGNKCRCCRLLEDTCVLLEEKEATMEELEQVFAVFDKDGEGYINASKLQVVLCRLEFKEGMKLKDCEKMISVFDQNGDGKIDFFEFRKLLESVE